MNKFSSQKIIFSKYFCYSFFDDYIFAGYRFQLVQGLESSFDALDLIVSQNDPRRTRGQQHLERSSKRGHLEEVGEERAP